MLSVVEIADPPRHRSQQEVFVYGEFRSRLSGSLWAPSPIWALWKAAPPGSRSSVYSELVITDAHRTGEGPRVGFDCRRSRYQK